MGYFDQIEFVSNSDLGALQKAMQTGELEAQLGRLRAVYDFGNLLDAMATQPERLSGQGFKDGDRLVEFNDQEWEKAKLMKAAIDGHPALSFTFTKMRKQHEFYRTLTVEHMGQELQIKARCKTDGDLRAPWEGGGHLGIDLKTTAAKNEVGILKAFHFFQYDRQAAWYMDVANLDRFLFVFVSKYKVRGEHPVFKLAIQRGDEWYQRGKRKYNRLAFLYACLIQSPENLPFNNS